MEGLNRPSPSRLRHFAVLSLVWSLLASIGFAGGPLFPLGDGQFARWDVNQPVSLMIDNGPLATTPAFTIGNEVGVQMVQDSINIWNGVTTAMLVVEHAGAVPGNVNIDKTNFTNFINQVNQQAYPVVFDADGKIHEMLFGGPSNSVIGFANAYFAPNSNDDFLDGAHVVMNGSKANTSPNSGFRKTITHEIGHLLGLDHTQAGSGVIPVMYPFISPGANRLFLDDQVWFSYLYPAPGFSENSGTIKGKIRRRTGGPFLGANVVAVPVRVDPDRIVDLPFQGLVSVVSDFGVTLDGSYEIPGLPDGNYAVYIEGLNGQFVDGSGVGPYDFRFSDFDKDYYNGEKESGITEGPDADNPTEKVALQVQAGVTIENIDLVSNESVNKLETLGDDDEELYVFPEGFSFPFFGKVYTELSVNTDGNMTFIGGDSTSFPRDEQRFLSSLPRIAPLFTDLNPQQGGSISAAFDGDSITFTWDGVPEFSDISQCPTRAGNSFSATLFSNGDILFQYGQIDVTPDAGGLGCSGGDDDLQIIVGLNPGGSAAGSSIDLSATAQPFSIGITPVYEVFLGTSFDLSGAQLMFEAATSQFHLLFPVNDGNASDFTGFAVTNQSDADAILQLEGLDAGGVLQDYPANPNQIILGSKKQTAQLGSQLFGLDLQSELDGWVRIGSNTDQLASFFQLGNGLNDGVTTKLDGSVAFTEQSQVLYFTRIHDGPGSFPAMDGPQDAETIFSLANPNSEAVTLTLHLFDGAGNAVGDPVERVLGPNGCLQESISSLFGTASVSEGFVRVDVDGPGAVGFGLVRLADTLLGFNASFGNSDTVAYSAQLAHGGAGGLIFTSFKLTNTDSVPRNVTVSALDEGAGALGDALIVPLGPNQSFEMDVGEAFDLGPFDVDPAVDGSLRVEADGPGVIGDIVFGDPHRLRYGAALPLQTQRVKKAVFSQVANRRGGSNADNTFTGVAFYHPGDVPATVTVKVFTAECVLTGETTFVMQPGTRMSPLLEQLIPATAGQVLGSIEVDSDEAIVLQELFGNFTLEYMSAVPPTVFE